MSSSLLDFSNLTFSYPHSPPALKNVSLSIAKGEKIALLGPNGAGKSTLFLCANGVLVPEEGSLALHGQTVTRQPKSLFRLRQSVGIVFQDPSQQFVGSTVAEDISFGPLNLGLSTPVVAERVGEALTALNLHHLASRPPHYLSGGEKKRASIGGVVAMEPELILFDEPTASLDQPHVHAFRAILASLSREGRALVVSTHDLDFAYSWADRVILFDKGALVADGPAQEVLQNQPLLASVSLEPPLLLVMARLLHEQGLLKKHVFPTSLEEMKQALA